MRNLAPLLYGYFYYTRAERNASIVLALLCLVFFLLPNFFPYILPPKPPMDFSKFKAAIIAATAERPIAENDGATDQPKFRNATPHVAPVELFKFDPNTASKDELVRLGLSPRTAQTLLNFRSKGGKFFKKDDLKRVYGLRQEDYHRLEEWVSIEEKASNFSKDKWDKKPEVMKVSETANTEKPEKPYYPKKEYEPAIIDINTATAEEWQRLRGIGPGYSKRIVNFRNKLGGFASIKQIGETYGLPDSVFQKIVPFLTTSPISKKIAVNKCNLDELKTHPYISSYQATILFNYRKQHGSFSGMEDLKKIKAGFKAEDWERLEAYLSFE